MHNGECNYNNRCRNTYLLVSASHHTSYTGMSPIDTVPPVEHQVVHYPDLSDIFGKLKLLWLLVFERFNKKIKNLVGNKNHPEKSVANAMVRDAGMFACIHTQIHTCMRHNIHACVHCQVTIHHRSPHPHIPTQLRVINSGRRRRSPILN